MNTPVVLLIADDFIRPALYRLLRRWPELDLRIDDPEPGDVVVTTPRDCSLDMCRELTAMGCSVVVLAPVWRAAARREFLRAGAANYVAMDLNSARLAETIRNSAPAILRVTQFRPSAAAG